MPEAESFEDHLRVMIRYASAMLLRRAQRLDVSHLVTHKLLPAIAAHIHIYMKARPRCEFHLYTQTMGDAVARKYTLITHFWSNWHKKFQHLHLYGLWTNNLYLHTLTCMHI